MIYRCVHHLNYQVWRDWWTVEMEILVKTPLGLEKIAAERIRELEAGVEVVARPHGYEGLVLIEKCGDKYRLARLIEDEVLEAERVIAFEEVVPARIEAIIDAAVRVAEGRVSRDESFAVRTVRRGRHEFTSVDVNAKVGARIAASIGAAVNLDYPDKIVQVEILQDRAGISILDGRAEWRKMDRDKRSSLPFFSRVSIVQMPYLGPPEGARQIGGRIGRAVQAYEVDELVIAPNKAVDASELVVFLQGIEEGIESRYQVQKRSYSRTARRVKVLVQDLYQLVRERSGESLIVFEPEGVEIRRAVNKLRDIFSRGGRVNLLFGSREGIPKGIYRRADLVIDLAPEITLPTELAAPAALAEIYTVLSMETQD
ncbi:MAG: SPOUT family RNA methylase [Nitrososphaerota archaeon]